MDKVAKERDVDPDDLFIELMSKKYINRNYEIRTENRDAFYADYPEFATGVGSNKVTDVIIEEQEFAESKSASDNAGGFAPADRPSPSSAGDGFMNIPDGIDEELPFN